ncbi:MAG: DUF3619 family protein [Betaproteobacteria bacterium]|nr:DUF3619 family protein [Betaproteobacteria bacterium]
MNENQTAFQIRQLLDQQLEDLVPEQLERLRSAREQALSRQRKVAPSMALAWADSAVGRFANPGSIFSGVLLPTAMLIFGLVAINYWQQAQLAAEIEEIDAAVLTGELPLDAYLDKDFDAWLKRSSH